MKLKNKHIVILVAMIAVAVMTGCSAQKNTPKSRFWHSFNAKYNTYYNGTVAYIDGSLEKENGNKDNFTEIIPLYTVGNKQSVQLGSGNFDKAIEKSEKAIKLHSIKKKPEWKKKRRKTEKDIEWLGRKEYNPMLWKAWMLMGRSQFHKGDFDASAATFSYMSRLYQTQPAIYGKARAWLAKCYIEQQWLYDAEDVIRNMKRDSIHWSARKEWDYTYADYYIHTGEYEKAIPYLQQVIKHEGRRKQKARECFLLGQLYAQTGKKDEAFKAYRRVIRQNPPYELEFNARIAMTEVMASGQSKKMISKLKSMARNDNNKEYLDQVYYALGNIYMTQRDTVNAISAYEKGNTKSTRNGIEKGVLLLRLGDIYWDMEKYADAGRCYGEAIGLLDKDRKDYKQLADRSKKLDELVPYTEAIHLQDSLQELAKMSEKDRNAAIDRVIEALKKKEKEEKDKAAEEAAQQTMNRNGQQNGRTNTPQAPNQQNKGQWYFYNAMAVNQGKQQFQKQWGKRENVDHWRRTNKTVVNFGSEDDLANLTDEQRDSLAAAQAKAEAEEEVADSAQNDPHKREYYLAQIPFSEEDVEASNLVIMDGLYNSGVIFKDKLDNLRLSEKQFARLLTQYPTFERMEDAYYHLFLLYSRLDEPSVADGYVEKLKQEYPESKWTTLLTDPHFVENQKFGIHIEDSLYAATYDAFKADRFSEIRTNAKLSEERFPLGANRDKFIFINGLSKLNAGDASGCLEDMNKVVKEFPQSQLATMAGMIVNGVKEGKKLRGGKFDMSDVWARRSAVMNDSDSIAARQFVDERNTDFVFMIAYEPDSLNENQLLYELAKYNFTSYMVRNFELEIEDQDGLHVMKVSGFHNYDEAFEYAHQFYRQQNITDRLGKSRTMIISEQNRQLLGVNFSYDDYDKYYDEHFAPLQVVDRQRLFEQAGIDDEVDDGSVPANISPVLLPKVEEKENADENDNDNVIDNFNDNEVVIDDEENANVGANENEVIVEEEQPAAPVVEDEVIIEDENNNVNENNDNEVVIDDEENANVGASENEVIVEEEQPVAPVVEDEVIIVDDNENVNVNENDDEFIIDDSGNINDEDDDIFIITDDDEDEGSEDEYLELEGF